MKYDTLEELQEAYASGELTEDDPLWLDNDCTFVYAGEEKVFNGGDPRDLLIEALELLEIPSEGV